MNQVTISAERFAEIIKIDFSIPDREFQNSRTSNISDLFHYTLHERKYREYDILTAQAVDELIFDLSIHFTQWAELNRHSQIILTSLRTKLEFTNISFAKILTINLASYIDCEKYKVLLFILCLKEFRRINLENPNSDLAIALKEIDVLIELKIFPIPFSEIAQKTILNFVQAEGMHRGREQ